MTKEEILKMREDMHKGVKMFIEELEKAGKSEKLDWQKAMYMSDILKDMSKVEKNLSEANYYDRKTS